MSIDAPYVPTVKHSSVLKTKLKTAGDRSFSLAAPKNWNDLPTYVRNAPSLPRFKTELKTHYFRLAYNDALRK